MSKKTPELTTKTAAIISVLIMLSAVVAALATRIFFIK